MADKKEETVLAQEVRQYDSDGTNPTMQFALDPGLNWWKREIGEKGKWTDWILGRSPRAGSYTLDLVDERDGKDDTRPLRSDYELPIAKAPVQDGQPKAEQDLVIPQPGDETVHTAQEVDETQAGVAGAAETGVPVVDPAVFPNPEDAPNPEPKKTK